MNDVKITEDENRILDLFWVSVAEAALLHAAMLHAGHEHDYHDAPWFARLWLDTERTRPWTEWGTPEQIEEARRVLSVVAAEQPATPTPSTEYPTVDPVHRATSGDSLHNAWRAGYRLGWDDRGAGREWRKYEANPYPEAALVSPVSEQPSEEWTDPEPYLQVYASREHAPFSRRATGGGGAVFSPRTREQYEAEQPAPLDPEPWESPFTDLRSRRQINPNWSFKPRPEFEQDKEKYQ